MALVQFLSQSLGPYFVSTDLGEDFPNGSQKVNAKRSVFLGSAREGKSSQASFSSDTTEISDTDQDFPFVTLSSTQAVRQVRLRCIPSAAMRHIEPEFLETV